jgi:dihydroorotate dehydrogenase electron transfer subunit
MSEEHPLLAKHYADDACWLETEIEANEPIARNTYRLRFAAPGIATRIFPGQFVMVRLAGCLDPLIGRPFALFDIVRNGAGMVHAMDVVYLVKGKLTSRLVTMQPGQRIQVWGPLGNGFATTPCEELLMVAGGVGMTPFLALAKEALNLECYGRVAPNRASAAYAKRCRLFYGVRSAGYVAAEEEFSAFGVEVCVCTDDGSRFPRARVPDLLSEGLQGIDKKRRRIATCGPEIMMEKVAEIAINYSIPCEISLETPMACGIGICFSCVARIRQTAGSWDYKRTCVDGPVFPAESVVW